MTGFLHEATRRRVSRPLRRLGRLVTGIEELDEQHVLLPASDPARDAGRAAAQVRFVSRLCSVWGAEEVLRAA